MKWLGGGAWWETEKLVCCEELQAVAHGHTVTDGSSPHTHGYNTHRIPRDACSCLATYSVQGNMSAHTQPHAVVFLFPTLLASLLSLLFGVTHTHGKCTHGACTNMWLTSYGTHCTVVMFSNVRMSRVPPSFLRRLPSQSVKPSHVDVDVYHSPRASFSQSGRTDGMVARRLASLLRPLAEALRMSELDDPTVLRDYPRSSAKVLQKSWRRFIGNSEGFHWSPR